MRCKVCDDPACKREQAEKDVTAAVARYMEASQSPLFVEACEINPLDKKPEHVAEFDRVTGLRRGWEMTFDVMKRANADCASRPAVDWRKRALDAEAKLRWVSVKERLPEADRLVLLSWSTSQITTGRWYAQSKMLNIEAGFPANHEGIVTHWMPLPDAPETP